MEKDDFCLLKSYLQIFWNKIAFDSKSMLQFKNDKCY